MAKIAPSVLGADFSRLGEEIKSADEAGVEVLHLDIMDGHFVPNISFGPAIVKTIDKLTGAFLDVHLMLTEPEKYFEAFVDAGADSITFHYKVHPEPQPYAEQLRKLGVKTGISINPDVEVAKVLPHLEHFDLLLLMSVYPGFGGQKFIRPVLSKIMEARNYIDKKGIKTIIQVDGGIDRSNAAEVVKAGADWLVMGTAFFGCDNRPELVKYINNL
ncbi:MAG: ribulose-phosphate 3-epimerase [candidate division Zixibacteria bacterium]|nr:ribulose-phosphate 3-epimerase [candidate division Zixibacteria bacterium]MDD5427466.1 ribulose-phosphate 3-epimerase [candidate division Zixibacteria bacterium]